MIFERSKALTSLQVSKPLSAASSAALEIGLFGMRERADLLAGRRD